MARIDSDIMRRFVLPASALILIALVVSAPDSDRLAAQNRMTYSVVSPDNGHVALGSRSAS